MGISSSVACSTGLLPQTSKASLLFGVLQLGSLRHKLQSFTYTPTLTRAYLRTVMMCAQHAARSKLSIEQTASASSFTQHSPVRPWTAHKQARSRIWKLLSWMTGRSTATCALSAPYLSLSEYVPPAWAKQAVPPSKVPQQRFGLAMLPTPVHPWHLPGLPEGVQVWIKRDDLTGMQLSGNKVRKLEFLMAEAKQQGHDCVVTIGGIQSNHCRATAIAAKYCGLPAHLLLRTSRQVVQSDPGLVGNLLLDRLVGAQIHLVTKEEYARHGSSALGAALVAQLREQGLNPYLIPVGGSNALGTWGYLQAVEEVRQQCSTIGLTDLAMACGSGGTTAGLALGVHLTGMGLRVHAYGVCDTPDYFYDHIDELIAEMGFADGNNQVAARAMFRAVQAKGEGYAISTEEELHTIKAVCEATGILLDPVYSGKAVHALLQEIRAQPEAWKGRKILFVHTGGLLGMYDKLEQLQAVLQPGSQPTNSTEPAATPDTSAYGLNVTRFAMPS